MVTFEENKTIYFFVSTYGSDSNRGTFDEPFATLHRAQKAARSAKQTSSQPVRIWVREGTYYLNEPLCFTPEDSGLTLEPYENETVVISGGHRLALEWSAYRDGIWQAAVPKDMEADQLYIDGKHYWMARYPNFDETEPNFNGYAADCLSVKKAAQWADPRGGFIHALHKNMWGGFHYIITGKKENEELLYEGGWQNNRQNDMHDEYRYVENIFEELDAPGEWYLDRNAHILYVYPLPGTDLNNAVVETVSLRHLIEFTGREGAPVRDITVKGLTFRHALRTFMDTLEPLLRSDWTIYRGGAVLFRGCEDCAVEDCFFDRLGGNALFVSGYNRRIAVRGCHIANAGASGIVFAGEAAAVRSPLFEYAERQRLQYIDQTSGPLTEDYPADCLVENCLIYRCGRIEKQSAPIQISMSQRITVRHCSIYEVPRAGINISDGTWGGHLIEYNDVFDTVLETGDHGSFNSWGRDRYWELEDVDLHRLNEIESDVRSDLPILDAAEPVIIRNNRWRCDHGWDIDLDDGSSNYHIYNNLCLNGGIKLREGFYRHCENNIMVNNTLHPHVWYVGSQDIFRHNIVCQPYRYGRVPQPWGKVFDRNLHHVPGVMSPRPAVTLQQMSGRDAQSIVADAQFVDPAAGDYSVSEDSPALRLGFKNFPMDQFGVKKEQLRRIARTPELPPVLLGEEHVTDTEMVYEWEGVSIKNVSGLDEISIFGLPDESGVWVVSIWPECELAAAGLQEADVIVELAGKQVSNVDALLALFSSAKAEGERPIKMVIVRNQQRRTIMI